MPCSGGWFLIKIIDFLKECSVSQAVDLGWMAGLGRAGQAWVRPEHGFLKEIDDFIKETLLQTSSDKQNVENPMYFFIFIIFFIFFIFIHMINMKKMKNLIRCPEHHLLKEFMISLSKSGLTWLESLASWLSREAHVLRKCMISLTKSWFWYIYLRNWWFP